jgi:ABC-type branched-subunit amino acid transport system substrate-binding protein
MHIDRSEQSRVAVGIRRRAALVLALLAVGGATMTACSSTSGSSTSSTGSSTASSSTASHRAPVPASAFTSTTGLTSSTVTIGNVSTETAGLFTGSVVGTEAYADYVNSLGGVNGRKLVVDTRDDQFTGAGNKQQTQAAVSNDFALVGSFSLEDSFGQTVLAQYPQVPDVSTTLAPSLNTLPNTFSANPTGLGWPTGPLDYFKKLYPTQTLHTAVLSSEFPSALASWQLEQPVLKQAGYKLAYYSGVPLTQTDFTQNVVDMRSKGVQLIYIDQLPENYAGALLKALEQQNFHPALVIGTASYSEALVPAAGGAAVDGSNLEMPNALFLGEDASQIPAVNTFLKWVQKASPGFKADYYTLAGWANTQLFVQALRAAGTNPTQGSVLQQLRKITSFNASNLLATTNPADRKQATCYLIAKVVNGQFVRSDDPPVNGPTNGYRCDGGFIAASG